jgi:hypothetical protein
MSRICSVVLVISLLLVGCSRKAPRIHYIVPVGFRGAIILYTNCPDGIPWQKTDSILTCTIPTKGVVCLKDAGVLEEWHSLTAAFDDGQALPIAFADGSRLSPREVAIWPLWTNEDSILYFVGASDEYRKAKAAWGRGVLLVPGNIISEQGSGG